MTEITLRLPELKFLPIIVEYEIGSAQPDVGYMDSYVEDWYVVGIGSRYLRKGEKAEWIYKKIREGRVDVETAIMEEVFR